MKVYVTNDSTVISDAEVQTIMLALHTQGYHLQNWWHTQIPKLVFGKPPIEEAWQIQFLDDTDQADALAYHDYTPGGRPIQRVFCKTIAENGDSISGAASHEWCETICDAWCNNGVQSTDTQWVAQEICDPVEDDRFGYKIRAGHEQVLVSDFVLPYWFMPDAKGQFDYKGYCSEPLQILEGGYMYFYENGEWNYEDSAGNKGKAADAPEDRRRLQFYAKEKNGS